MSKKKEADTKRLDFLARHKLTLYAVFFSQWRSMTTPKDDRYRIDVFSGWMCGRSEEHDNLRDAIDAEMKRRGEWSDD